MKNDKAVLVLLAYVIGFTTAFIAFGLQQENTENNDYRHEPSVPSTANQEVEVIFTDSGMFAKVDETEVVISGKLSDGIPSGPGFHASIPRHSTSPSGKYIYYCEQQSGTDSSCHDLLYIVGKHLTKPLKVEGSTLVTSVADSGFKWTDNDMLSSEEYISESENEPWKLHSR